MNTQYINEQIQVLQTALKQYDAIFDSFDRDIAELGKIVNQINFALGTALEVIEELAPGKFKEMLDKKIEEAKQMQAKTENEPTITEEPVEENHIILE